MLRCAVGLSNLSRSGLLVGNQKVEDVDRVSQSDAKQLETLGPVGFCEGQLGSPVRHPRRCTAQWSNRNHVVGAQAQLLKSVSLTYPGCMGSNRKESHRERGVICHVSRTTGVRYYYAVVSVGMARLTSRKSRDQEAAVQRHGVLVAIRRHAVARPSSAPPEERLRMALVEVLAAHRLDAVTLGLRLSVSLWAYRWIGLPLTTPSFSAAGACLERGLIAWRWLRDARKRLIVAERDGTPTCRGPPAPREREAWVALRETFLDVEAEAGFDRSQRAARMKRAELARSQHHARLFERWNRRQQIIRCRTERAAARAAERSAQRFARDAARRAAKSAVAERRLQKRAAAAEARDEKAIERLLAGLARIEERLRAAPAGGAARRDLSRRVQQRPAAATAPLMSPKRRT